MLGMIIGRITGNYPVAIIASLFPDLDHLWVYYKHSVLFNRELFKTMYYERDDLGEQRNYLHSIFTLVILSLGLWYFYPRWIIPFVLGYIGHMLLDSLDMSELMPFYPFRFRTRGFIGYLSKAELLFFAVLVGIFFFMP
jgi:membrane-bound metal-dependent hydrolase YbcI (DUF457 family)